MTRSLMATREVTVIYSLYLFLLYLIRPFLNYPSEPLENLQALEITLSYWKQLAML